jgi:hypothetical protein
VAAGGERATRAVMGRERSWAAELRCKGDQAKKLRVHKRTSRDGPNW